MIMEYLETRDAYGKSHVISTKDIMNQYHMTKRAVVRRVAREREEGALICSTTAKGGGYFLPATAEDIAKEKAKMEIGIARRARVLRPFRAFMKQQREIAKSGVAMKTNVGGITEEKVKAKKEIARRVRVLWPSGVFMNQQKKSAGAGVTMKEKRKGINFKGKVRKLLHAFINWHKKNTNVGEKE